jgi:tRNA pseudouridine38-40 synthase
VTQLPLERAGGERVLKLTVAYDGTDFRGFAAQPGQRTVEAVLRDVLERVLQRDDLALTCAGRTDAGVHAWGQVVALPVGDDVDGDRVAWSVTRQLGPEVVVRDAAMVDGPFDARRDARWRAYRYTIVNRPAPDPFLARTAWWVPEPLDLSLLRLGADPFLGEHDFAAFCRRRVGATTVRTLQRLSWHRDADRVLTATVEADAFCHSMVRSLVGALLDVGTGARDVGWPSAVLAARVRDPRVNVAPAHGLVLAAVSYPDAAALAERARLTRRRREPRTIGP